MSWRGYEKRHGGGGMRYEKCHGMADLRMSWGGEVRNVLGEETCEMSWEGRYEKCPGRWYI